MITNYASFIAFAIGLVCLLIFLFFLTPKQFSEVLRPRDYLTRLRWYILLILLVGLLTAIPSVVYQYYRSIGQDHTLLRNISTVSSQISKLATTVLLFLVYTYKNKDD